MTEQLNAQTPQDRLLRLRDIIGPQQRLLPVSRSTFYSLVAAGRIPRPTKLGPRIAAWRESQILAYIASGEAAND